MTAATVSRDTPCQPADVPHHASLWEFVRASGLRSLVVGTSKDPNAKVTILLVSPETGRPVLALKVPTTEVASLAVESERRLLAELHALLPARVRETLPEVVDLVEFEGRTAAVMTAVPGTPMLTSTFGWRHTARLGRVSAAFAAVEAWLADFQRETVQTPERVDVDGGVTARLQSRFPDDPHLGADLDRLAEIHAHLRENTTPRTAVHGDMWIGNVLMTGGRVSGIVDWEAGAVTGEPLRDIVRFATTYAVYLDRGTPRGRRVAGHRGLRAGSFGAGLEFALNGTGWFPELFRSFLENGLVRLGASAAAWRHAALAGLTEIAALTDDHSFARLHLDLFRRLTTTLPRKDSR